MNKTSKKAVVATVPAKEVKAVSTKKTVVVTPVVEVKKVVIKKEAAVVVPVVTEKKVAAKKAAAVVVVEPVVVAPATALEVVTVATTTYHNWRHWVKDIAKEGGVISAKFVKESVGYNGKITAPKSQVAKLKATFASYQKANPDTKELWTII